MKIIEKLEKYFNTGSTDQQNKRRLGGLLVAITAILLVICILAAAGCGIFVLVSNIIDNASGNDGGDGSTSVNRDLVSVSAEQIATDAAINTKPLIGNDVTLTAAQYNVLTKENRAKNADEIGRAHV